jgi:hypothetical protein
MRSTLHGPEAFLLKSKKPHIQLLVARVNDMTLEDIEKLDEKPDIKAGLRNIKKQGEQAASHSRAELLADLMIAKHHPGLSRQDA